MTTEKKPRGFAAMDPQLQRELASRGGRAVDPQNRTFSRDRRLASAAGRNGGLSAQSTRRRSA